MKWVALFALLVSQLAAAPSIAAVRAHLIEWEGYRTTPYRDGLNGYSVGIGHNLTVHQETPRAHYSAIQIERLFLRDYSIALDAIRAAIPDFDNLPKDAQLVLIGVVWGTGPTGFARFKDLIFSVNHKAWNAAHNALYWSKWRVQVGEKRAQAYIAVLNDQS